MPKRLIAYLLSSLLICATSSYAQTAQKSTEADQTDVEVTVYNNNLGLVKDTRNISLPAGNGELNFMDVAAQIMPVTVAVRSLNQPADFAILEQNYEYDLMSYSKLLDKYVGKDIKIVDWNQFQDRKETVDATLLSNNGDQPIYRIADQIYLGHPGYKVLPQIPENLIAKPTLTWLYENTANAPHELEVSYLTNGIGWRADYVVILNDTDTSLDLSGWVTLDNRSGTAYNDAKLKLVAGEVNRVRDLESDSFRREQMPYATLAAAGRQFEEQAFFEYHIYDLGRRTTIKDNQTKQISLLDALDIKVKKELITYGIASYFSRKFDEKFDNQPVNVYIRFKNSKDNNLGMPIPAGIMRVYKKDHDQKLQFIGEDRVDHTPKDEDIKLKLGKAFDIIAERVQKDYKMLSRYLHESAWEITLKNHGESATTVAVVEPLFGSWQIVENSHPYEKLDAATIQFKVDIPKDGEVKVTYRARVGL